MLGTPSLEPAKNKKKTMESLLNLDFVNKNIKVTVVIDLVQYQVNTFNVNFFVLGKIM